MEQSFNVHEHTRKQYNLWDPCLFRLKPGNLLFAQDVFTASISSDMRKELEGYRVTDDKYAIVINRSLKKKEKKKEQHKNYT